jgi:hypothetical protein
MRRCFVPRCPSVRAASIAAEEELISARRDDYRAAIMNSNGTRELAITRGDAPRAMMALGVELLAAGASIEQAADAMQARVAAEDAQGD